MSQVGDLRAIANWLSDVAQSGKLGDEFARDRIAAGVMALRLHAVADDVAQMQRPPSAREREGRSWWRRAWRTLRPRRIAY